MASISVAPDQENINSNRNSSRLPTKQIGVTGLQSTTKKKALADVKNTLHQRNTASASASKKHGSNGHSKYENSDAPMKVDFVSKLTNGNKSVVDEDINVEICSCTEPSTQDDYSDILFKNIRLSKSQIETLSMEWEKTPVYSQRNKRGLDFPEAASFDIDYDFIAMKWSNKDHIVKEDFEVPPPELDAKLAEFF